MSNRIIIKHGNTDPTKENLNAFELGYNSEKKKLYIGQPNETEDPLCLNPDPPTLEVDKTLTKEGTAADAKAAGDVIRGLNSRKQNKLTAGENIDITGDVISSAWFARPNLLHNWYFGNPVNQRGRSEYTGSQYSIDRWKVQSGTSVSVIDGALRLSGMWDFWQILPKAIDCPSVFSVLFKDNTKFFVLIAYNENGETIGAADSSASDGLISLVLPAGVKTVSINMANKGGTVDLIAAKLELGSTQTLAHQENDVWYINEIPDYDVQLIQCQRYYQKRSIVLPITSAGTGWYTFPIELRALPSVVVTIDSSVIPQFIHSYGFAITGLSANNVLNATYEASADL